MPNLIDCISVEDRFARSVNLDRDSGRVEPLRGYIVTKRAKNVLQRVSSTAAFDASGGAWSLTGPYGSGKSSLAILIDSMFGPRNFNRNLSWELIQKADPTILDSIEHAHRRYGTLETGFYRGLVTANQESVCRTIFRAVHSAVFQKFGKIPRASEFPMARLLRSLIREFFREDSNNSASPTALLELIGTIAEHAPLLLIVDEFGKNLEAIHGDSNNDPYLLQQIAELGQSPGTPIFLITLQHQTYEDYFEGEHTSLRREWSKVRGRFEEITYVESAGQSRALISSAFKIESKFLGKKIDRWARTQYKKLHSTGTTDFDSPESIAVYYPLNPLTTMVLPELCSRFGQHERTMFSFLASAHVSSVKTFLKSTPLAKKHESLPSVGLDVLYDFFVAESTLTCFSHNQTSKWIEIVTRLRDIHGLSKREIELAKSIAVLNLISMHGPLRASLSLLSLVHPAAEKTIKFLESIELVTYRQYADEYRIWQGTDVDIDDLVAKSYQQMQSKPLVEILRAIDTPTPTIAARNSAQYETLRIFSKRYVGEKEIVNFLDVNSPYDGEILLVVGNNIPSIKKLPTSAKPVVAVIPNDVDQLERISRVVAAISTALNEQSVKNDWVARSELEERLAHRRSELNREIYSTFNDSTSRWMLLDSTRIIELPSGIGSAPLSAAADKVYASTPIFRNEMINRAKLSTQGAKARRTVIEAMIKHENESRLGLKGYGPEVAVYTAILQQTGLHRTSGRNKSIGFRRPTEKSVLPAWKVIDNDFNLAKLKRVNVNDIFTKLMLPPIGMKLGVVSVFFTAALLAFRDKIAIYEHGTFRPLFTVELSERMVKNPNHFDIKHFANTTGSRMQVIKELESKFKIKFVYRSYRVSNVLSIVNHLVSSVRLLNNYALRTSELEPTTIAVRECLLNAVEPDKLIFESLPNAVNLPPILTSRQDYKHAKTYASRIYSAIQELTQCFNNMLTEIHSLILKSSREPSKKAISGIAASLQKEILDPTIKAFAYVLAEDEPNKFDWATTVGTVVLNKAPAEWTDSDVKRFNYALAEQMAAFRRLVALHVEHRADGGGEFRPFRITVTAPDGKEFIDTVSIDEEVRDDGAEVLKNCIERLAKVFGSDQRAKNALLALLGEEMLSDLDQTNSVSNGDIKLRRLDSG